MISCRRVERDVVVVDREDQTCEFYETTWSSVILIQFRIGEEFVCASHHALMWVSNLSLNTEVRRTQSGLDPSKNPVLSPLIRWGKCVMSCHWKEMAKLGSRIQARIIGAEILQDYNLVLCLA